MKEELIGYIKEKGYEVIDCGTDSADSCHYPEFASKVSESVLSDLEGSYGILICGTGIGMSMCANKYKGIRAALCGDTYSAKMTRRHNDANVLCMGARVIGGGAACELVDVFLSTEFEGGRHQRRVDQIMAIENGEIL